MLQNASPPVSRRDVLRGTACFGLLALTGCSTPEPAGPALYPAHPDLAALADSIVSVDMHTHAGGVHFRRTPQYDIADTMRQGHLAAACLCHTGDGPVIQRTPEGKVVTSRQPEPGELYKHTLERLAFMDRVVESEGLRRMLKPGDLEHAHADRAQAIVQGIEGCQFLDGKLERIGEMHRRGVRQMQPVHFFKSDLGDNQTEQSTQGGLSALGREMIAECNRVGMVVDVAHATMQFVQQAAAVCRTPLVLSHAAVVNKPPGLSRHISREHARVIAQTGGVVGIWMISDILRTWDQWASNVALAVDTVGVDHVGIGSDIGGAPANLLPDYRSFGDVLNALRKRGFSNAEIRKIAGENYVRVFNQSVRAV